MHARKFAGIIDHETWRVEDTHIPPSETLTNEAMELFFVMCFETGSKAQVQQGRKWIRSSPV